MKVSTILPLLAIALIFASVDANAPARSLLAKWRYESDVHDHEETSHASYRDEKKDYRDDDYRDDDYIDESEDRESRHSDGQRMDDNQIKAFEALVHTQEETKEKFELEEEKYEEEKERKEDRHNDRYNDRYDDRYDDEDFREDRREDKYRNEDKYRDEDDYRHEDKYYDEDQYDKYEDEEKHIHHKAPFHEDDFGEFFNIEASDDTAEKEISHEKNEEDSDDYTEKLKNKVNKMVRKTDDADTVDLDSQENANSTTEVAEKETIRTCFENFNSIGDCYDVVDASACTDSGTYATSEGQTSVYARCYWDYHTKNCVPSEEHRAKKCKIVNLVNVHKQKDEDDILYHFGKAGKEGKSIHPL